MDGQLYRETLFARALDRLLAAGYKAAYLINAAGLVFAKTSGATGQEGFGVLTAAAAALIKHVRTAGFGDVTDLQIALENGDVVAFYRFRNVGETAGEYFIAAISDGDEADPRSLASVAEEVMADLEAFY